MASFSPPTDTASPTDYTRNSEGPRAQANDGLGNLFKDVAQGVNIGVQEADRAEKQKINEDILSQSESIQNEFGVGDATNVQGDAESTAPATRPPALEKSYGNLDSLQNAYEQGALKESHYWARLNVMVRQLRAKYPGYRDDIDNMVAGVVGAKPANALQSQLFNEWQSDAQAKNAGANREQAFVESAAKDGTLPVDYFQRAGGGDPYSYTELVSAVADRNRVKTDLSAQQAMLANKATQNTLQKTEAENTFRDSASKFIGVQLEDGSKALGKSYQQIQTTVNKLQEQYANGTLPDETLLDQMRVQAGQLLQNSKIALDQFYTSDWDGDSQHSYSQFIDGKTKDDIINSALDPINTLISSLDAKNNPFAVIGATNSYVEAMKTEAGAGILKGPAGNVLLKISGMTKLVGSDVTSIILGLDNKLQDALTTSLLNNSVLDSTVGTGTVTQGMQTGVEANQTSGYFNGLIDKWQKLADHIDKGDLPPQLLQNSVSYFFGDREGQLAMLDDDSKYKWYSQMASPVVTNQMLKLKASGDTQSWDVYQSWVKSNFMSLFEQSVHTLQQSNQNVGSFMSGINNMVTWHPDTSSFSVASAPGPGVPPLNTLLSLKDVPGTLSVYQDVAKLNSVIATVKPIIEDSGGNVQEELAYLLSVMGFGNDDNSIPGAMLNEIGKGLPVAEPKVGAQ